MLLDRSGEIADVWASVADDKPIPPSGPVIVPLARLAEALDTRPATGAAIPNNANLAEIADGLPRLGLISIDFPSFADGRGFSIAQRLRDMGFEGRLRASGPVIADQFAYLLACGIDEVLVPEEVAIRQPAEQWMAQLTKISLGYQRGRALDAIADRRKSACP